MAERLLHDAEVGEPRYERSDAPAGRVALVGGIGLASVATFAIGLFFFVQFLMGAPSTPLSPISLREGTEPRPELLAAPEERLRSIDQEQLRQLHSYGWLDGSHEVAHIPIERAKELLLQQGWPGDPGGSAVGGPPAEPREVEQ
jgi:hypothetical protein